MIAPILVYVIGLVTMLALSAAYNICLAPAKWVLRRFDHSAMQVSGREPWRICR
jgi:predicted membrane channel-forming protein YqfA (hemolysin III family)